MKKRQTFYLKYGKRIFDVFCASMLLVFFSWLLLLLAALVKCTSKGPVLFTQKRVGKDKAYFELYKFRTMRIDTPKDMPTHLLKNPEQFITPVGRLLRRFSLDELPQLANILKGDMSFVGPRPALWNQEDLLAERDRYGANDIIPGLTGWAQVNGRDELSIPVKAAFDGEYVKKAGFWFDMQILLKTFFKVAEHDGVQEGGPDAGKSAGEDFAATREACVQAGQNPRRGNSQAGQDLQKGSGKPLRALLVGSRSYIAGRLAGYQEETGSGIQMEKVSASDGSWKNIDFSGFHTVVMLAALVHKKEKGRKAEEYDRVNCQLAVDVARKAKQAGVRQFVFFSSMAVYGSRASEIDANTCPAPDTLYGKSKYKAEQQLRRLEGADFAVAILRPPMVYGAGCPGNYQALKKFALHCPVFPDTENRRSMLGINRLCQEVTEIIRSGQGGTFLLQDKHCHNTGELVRAIRARAGKKTCLVKAFNGILIPMARKNATLRKVFGSQYYKQ